MKKSVVRTFEIASLAAGLALFAYLINETGADALIGYLSSIGWGFALILALSGVRNLVRATAWFYSMDPRHRNVGFRAVFGVMLAGEAIKYLTATGPLLGEPAKAAMMRRRVPLVEGVSSIIVENLTYSLSVILFMMAGLPALAWLADVPDRFKAAGYILAAGITIATVAVWTAIRRRWFVLARIFEKAASFAAKRRGAQSGPSRLGRIATRVRAVEENIHSFYAERRRAFFLVFALDVSSHLINVLEVHAILSMMGLRSSLAIGFVIEAVTKIINMVFFFVPTRAGVYEGGYKMIVDALGVSPSAGVALAIIRKIRAFAWAGCGLVVLAAMILRDRREMKQAET